MYMVKYEILVIELDKNNAYPTEEVISSIFDSE